MNESVQCQINAFPFTAKKLTKKEQAAERQRKRRADPAYRQAERERDKMRKRQQRAQLQLHTADISTGQIHDTDSSLRESSDEASTDTCMDGGDFFFPRIS